MDPKALSNLDPKLRETYERVMGTANSSSNPATPPTPNTSNNLMPTFDAMPAPKTTPTPDNTTPIPPPSSSNTSEVINQPIQSSELTALQSTLTPPSITTAVNPPQSLISPAEINQLPAQASKSTSPVIRILYILAGIIFFAVYIIFWLKVFKFPLPF